MTPSQYYSERKAAKKQLKVDKIKKMVTALLLVLMALNALYLAKKNDQYADLLMKKETIYTEQKKIIEETNLENESLRAEVSGLESKLVTLEELVVKLEDALLTLSQINGETGE